jgi:biotin carboxylase
MKTVKLYSVLLVNPFASAAYLSAELQRYPIQTTALYTIDMQEIPSYLLPNQTLFDKQIFIRTEKASEIIDKLGKVNFDYIINGLESTLKLHDELCSYYTSETANHAATSALRSDKHEMHRVLSQHHLSHIKQLVYEHKPKTMNVDLLKLAMVYPCFIKPLSAAASIGAKKINNRQELFNYFAAIPIQKNIWETKQSKDKFLIAEFVDGDEFVIDSFSIAGKHHFSCIQKYHKEYYNNSPLYRYLELETEPELIKRIEAYMVRVFHATDFFNGFAHSEIFLTKNNDIKLIEINPRISGGNGIINKLSILSHKLSQVDLLLKYRFGIEPPRHEEPVRLCRSLFLFNCSGRPLHNLKAKLQHWSSVYEVAQLAAEGSVQTEKNITLTNCVAIVILQALDQEVLDKHTHEILERDEIGW